MLFRDLRNPAIGLLEKHDCCFFHQKIHFDSKHIVNILGSLLNQFMISKNTNWNPKNPKTKFFPSLDMLF
jgi:hypothetical protein